MTPHTPADTSGALPIGDAELRALLADATPGPWTQREGRPEVWTGTSVPAYPSDANEFVGRCDFDADAQLLALAPSLAAEVIELRSLLAELRRERDAAVAVVEAVRAAKCRGDNNRFREGFYDPGALPTLADALRTYDTQPKAEP